MNADEIRGGAGWPHEIWSWQADPKQSWPSAAAIVASARSPTHKSAMAATRIMATTRGVTDLSTRRSLMR